MGSSKKQTVGYRYFMGLHFGLCHGPVDAFLELRGGDRIAWSGSVTASGQIEVDAPKLWGGEKKEGGLVGALDVMMGEDTQEPNDYLVSVLGTPMPAFRGILSLVFRKGMVGAMNPYPKPWKFRVRRILQGWYGGAAWYPETAEIVLVAGADPDVEPEGLVANLLSHGGGTVAGLTDFYAGDYPVFNNAAGTIPAVSTFRTTQENPEAIEDRLPRRMLCRQGATLLYDSGWLGNPEYQLQLEEGLAAAGRYDLVGVISDELSHAATVTLPDPLGTITTESYIYVPTPPSFGVHENILRVYSGLVPDTFTAPLVAMNPAHITHEALTNPDWGLGYPEALLDLDSFAAAADVFHAEGLGLCLQWTRQDSVEGFIQDVMNHAGAVLAQDPRTALFRLLPIRGDYITAELPEFRRGLNVLAVETFERAAVPETVNEVTVQYVDAATGKDGSVTVQHLANIQAQGGVAPQTTRYPGAPTAALAARLALRDVMAKATALCKVRLTVDRSGYGTLPGEVVRWSDEKLGVLDMPCRVLQVSYGSLTDGRITLDLAEDVFGLPATTYVGQQPGGWVEPDGTPGASPDVAAFEAPYVALHRSQGASVVNALDEDAGYLAMAAAKPSGVSYGFSLYTRTGAAEYEETGADDWSQGGLLSAGVGALDTVLDLAGSVGLDTVNVGDLAMLGEGDDAELVRVDAVDVAGGGVTVGRGVGDTTPRAWPIGARLWVIQDNVASSVVEFVAGETVDAKAVTNASGGELPLADAPGDSVTMGQRQARPYPPGKLRITDDLVTDAAYPESAAGELAVTWAHRDRLLQADQLVAEGEASIGPEAGTTYTVRYYLDDVLDDTQSGIAGTAATPYTLSGDGVARVEVEAVRDGLTSWQAATAEFDYLAEPPEARVTDATDTRITDSGDRRITD